MFLHILIKSFTHMQNSEAFQFTTQNEENCNYQSVKLYIRWEKKHYSEFFAMHKADYLPKMAFLLV